MENPVNPPPPPTALDSHQKELKTIKRKEVEDTVSENLDQDVAEELSAFAASVPLNKSIDWSNLTIELCIPLKIGVVYKFEISCFISSHIFDRLITNAGTMVVKKYAASIPDLVSLKRSLIADCFLRKLNFTTPQSLLFDLSKEESNQLLATKVGKDSTLKEVLDIKNTTVTHEGVTYRHHFICTTQS